MAGRSYKARALLASGSLVLLAFTSNSLAGAPFLLLFILWAGLCARPRLARLHAALWSAAAAAALALLVLQLLLQALLEAELLGPGLGPGSALWRALALRDLLACSPSELLLALVPQLLCFLASVSEAQEAASTAGQQRRQRRRLLSEPTRTGHMAAAALPPPALRGRDISGGGAGAGAGLVSSRAPSGGTAAPASVASAAALEGVAPLESTEGARSLLGSGSSATAGAAAQQGSGSAAAAGQYAGVDGRLQLEQQQRRQEQDGCSWTGEGSAAVALVAAAALLWPGAAFGGWMLLLAAGVLQWALRLGRPRMAALALRLGQCYCGLCLLLLYGAQLPPLLSPCYSDAAAVGARVLGLYRLSWATPLYDLVPQLLHLTAVAALYIALAMCVAVAEAAMAAAARDLAARENRREARGPLLPPLQQLQQHEYRQGQVPAVDQQGPMPIAAAAFSCSSAPETADPHGMRQQQHVTTGGASGSGRAAGGSLSAAAHALCRHAEALCAHPSVSAVALCGLSMGGVSVLGGVALLVGIWTLLAPSRYGRRMLCAASPVLAGLMLAWLGAVYVLTCTAHAMDGGGQGEGGGRPPPRNAPWQQPEAVAAAAAATAQLRAQLPPVLDSLGLFILGSPPSYVLPLAGQLLACLAVAGLARSRRGAGQWVGDGSSAWTLAVAQPTTALGSSNALGAPALAAAYCALHVLVPLSWALLGSYRVDLLHGGYLLWLVVYCGGTAAAVRPGLHLAPAPRAAAWWPPPPGGERAWLALLRRNAPPAHRLMRLYASAHLLALYAAMCGQLPGLHGLQKEAWRPLLELIGFWDPSLARDCLPLLGALLLASAHAVIGKAIATAAATAAAAAVGSTPPQAVSAAASAPAIAWVGRVVATHGSLLLAALAYCLVLYDARVGLLGALYLALGLPLVLLPPRRDDYVRALALRCRAAAPRREVVPGSVPELQAAPEVYLSAPPCSLGALRLALHWTGPVLLALYCVADLCLQYGVAVLLQYDGGDGGPPVRLPEAAWRLLRDLVGMDLDGALRPSARVAAALRPAVLLLALQLYRWLFAAAAVQHWQQQGRLLLPGADGAPASPTPQRSPPAATTSMHAGSGPAGHGTGGGEAELGGAEVVSEALKAQASLTWHTKRLVILHADTATCVLLFAVLMGAPGALAAAVLAAALAWAVARSWGAARSELARRHGGRGVVRRARRGAVTCRTAGGVAALQLALLLWAVVEYLLQVEAVAAALSAVSDPRVAAALTWLGLPLCSPRQEAPAALAAAATAAWQASAADGTCPQHGWRVRLGLKLLLLGALALKRTAAGWLSQVPLEVLDAAQPGSACALFWPPPAQRREALAAMRRAPPLPPSAAARAASMSGAAGEGLQRFLDAQLLTPIRAAAGQVLTTLGRGAYDVLVAMDVPADQLVGELSEALQGGQQALPLLPVPAPGGVASAAPSAADRRAGAPHRHHQQLQQGPGAGGARGAAASFGLPATHSAAAFVTPEPAPRPRPLQQQPGQQETQRQQQPAPPRPPLPATAASALGSPAAAAHQPAQVGTLAAAVPDPFTPPPPSVPRDAGAATPTHLPPQHLPAAVLRQQAERRQQQEQHWADTPCQPTLELVLLGLMEFSERFWRVWGGEVVLALLLLAAFTSCSVVSLPLLAALAAGMAVSTPVRQLLWRRLLLPLLGLMLLYQYSAWVGLPLLLHPTGAHGGADGSRHQPLLGLVLLLHGAGSFGAQLMGAMGDGPSADDAWAAWLGMGGVSCLAVWLLAAAAGGCWLQVWRELHSPSLLPDPGGYGSPHMENDVEAPLLLALGGATDDNDAVDDNGGGDARSGLLVRRRAAAHARSRGARAGEADSALRLFSPLEPWAKGRWHAGDWARFYLVRHAADLLLVALVALCAAQRDLLRAGYLAHALLLFRRRPELRKPSQGSVGGALLGRLVAYNLLVLALEVAAQAPLQLLLGPSWAAPCAPERAASQPPDAPQEARCTVPRLLGLCQLLQPPAAEDSGGGGGSDLWAPWRALLHSPVLPDLVLWLLLRLYGRLLGSRVFAKVMRLVELSHHLEAAKLRRATREGREAAARAALTASHARAASRRRTAKLKALLLDLATAGAGGSSGEPGAERLPALLRNAGGRVLLPAFSGSGSSRPGGGSSAVFGSLAELLDADWDLGELQPPQQQHHHHHHSHPQQQQPQQQSVARADASATTAATAVGGSTEAPSAAAPGHWTSAQMPLRSLDETYDQDNDTYESSRLIEGLNLSPTSIQRHRRARSETELSFSFPATAEAAAAAAAAGPEVRGGPSQLPKAAAGGSSSGAAAPAAPATGAGAGGAAAAAQRPVASPLRASLRHRRNASVESSAFYASAALAWDAEQQAMAGSGVQRAANAGAAASGAQGVEGGHCEELPPPRRRLPPQPGLLARLPSLSLGAVRRLRDVVFQTASRSTDDDSWTCYSLFVVLLLCDCSALALLLPLSVWLYSGLLRRKPRLYWQGVLVYAEALMVLQYSYLVMGRCLCADGMPGSGGGGGVATCAWLFGKQNFLRALQVLGLHDTPLRALPLFLVYLATLMHSYRLDLLYTATALPALQPQLQPPLPQLQPATVQATAASAALERATTHMVASMPSMMADPFSPRSDGGVGALPGEPAAVRDRMAAATTGYGHPPEASVSAGAGDSRRPWAMTALLAALSWRSMWRQAKRAGAGGAGLALHLVQVYRHVALDHEVPPNWVKVQLGRSAAPSAGLGLGSGASASSSTKQVMPERTAPAAGDAGALQASVAGEAAVGAAPSSAPATAVAAAGGATAPSRSGSSGPSWGAGAAGGEAIVAGLQALLDAVAAHDAEQARLAATAAATAADASLQPMLPGDDDADGDVDGGVGGGSANGSSGEGRPVRGSSEAVPPALEGSELRLRLAHVAVAANGTRHVLLEVRCATSGSSSSGRDPTLQLTPATPARDAARMLQRAAKAQARQYREAQALPPRRQQPLPQQQQSAGGAGAAGGPAGAAAGGTSGGGADAAGAIGAAPRRGSVPEPAADDTLRVPEPPGLPPLVSVESYSQPARDFYTVTAFVDLVSFVYAIIFYQLVANRSRSLADIADADRSLPLDYLGALLTLFGLAVLDRAAYTLGWPGAKLALHLASMPLLLGWCGEAFWRGADAGGDEPGSAAAARGHVRAFLALRCVSLTLGALQLRDGYPPLSAPGAGGAAGGRHAPFYYRRADWLHLLAYQVFFASPFLFELRTLLDWSCVATTLGFGEWLKMEDIRASLFVATVNNRQRAGRRLGQRVPRYLKSLQGFLSLSALFLVLWLPALLFSSGAPTYQIPALVDVHVNVSLVQVSLSEAGLPLEVLSRYSLYATGGRRSLGPWPPQQQRSALLDATAGLEPGSSAWLPNGLPHALSGYSPQQVRLLCLASDADQTWTISPPARRALQALLPPPPEDPPPAPPTDSPPSGRPAQLLLQPAGSSQAAATAAAPAASRPRRRLHSASRDTPAPAPDGALALEVRWGLVRSAPLASQRGGPGCGAGTLIPLSGPTRRALWLVLAGQANSSSVSLAAFNATHPGEDGSRGLFPLFMQLKGELCSVRLGLGDSGASPGGAPGPSWATGSGLGSAAGRRRLFSIPALAGTRGAHTLPQQRQDPRGDGPEPAPEPDLDPVQLSDMWADAWLACNATLQRDDGTGGYDADSGGSGAVWWSMACGALLPPPPGGGPAPALPAGSPCSETSSGAAGLAGPSVVAVLEPVQSGLLGATLSHFGLAGLYFTFVFALGRFLRLSVSNPRLRIPTEELPSTRRLVALCQDIVVARAEGDLALEEELYRVLINIYRSPDLLIEMSRKHKQA